MRRAGFKHAILLLEGLQWKAGKEVLQVDGATIRSERDLFRYMATEIMAGEKFLESPDQGRTVILLRAIAAALRGRGSTTELPWQSAVPKTQRQDVASRLFASDEYTSTLAEADSLTTRAKERTKELWGNRRGALHTASLAG